MTAKAAPKPKAVAPTGDGPDPRTLGMQTLCQLGERDAEQRTVAEAMELTAGLSADAALRAHHVAARRLALQLLYELDAGGAPADSIGAALDGVLSGVDDLGPMMRARVESLVLGTWHAKPSIDALLADLSPEWPPSRQPAVDRALLRLVIHEVASGATPASIAINEGVELARAFSTERSPSFVNGVLAKAVDRLDEIHAEPDPFAES